MKRDWHESALYEFIKSEYTRELIDKNKIKLLDDEKRPETPEIYKNKKPEKRQMININPPENEIEILSHVECEYMQTILVAQMDEDNPDEADEKIDLPQLYLKSKNTV